MHTPECIRDFGPLHGFWTFLFERLNKVLKGYSTNNHSGGEVEATFFREFHRSVLTSRLVRRTSLSIPGNETDNVERYRVRRQQTRPVSSAGLPISCFKPLPMTEALFRHLPKKWTPIIQKVCDTSLDFRLAVRKGATHPFPVGLSHTLSPRFERKLLPSGFYVELLQYLSFCLPDLKLHSNIHPNPPFDSIPLNRLAYFFDYAVIGGRRFNASGRGSPESRGNSMVQVKTSERGDTWIGELLDVVHLDQDPGLRLTLGHFRWMVPLDVDLSGSVWAPL